MIIRIATIAAILAIVLGAMQVGSVAFASGGAGGSCNNFRVDPNSSETVIENHSGTANYEFKNTGTKSFNVKVNGRKVLTVDPGETKLAGIENGDDVKISNPDNNDDAVGCWSQQ